MGAYQVIKEWKMFGGTQYVLRHASQATGTDMDVAVFVPRHDMDDRLPVLTFLSGLTCNWENFTTKAGAQRYAAEHNIILVMPDTSPRGDAVPNDDAYDLGQGAGFYVDATNGKWAANFKMWSYVNEDLPALLETLPYTDMARRGIAGHSMGGHGALVTAFRNPAVYRSVSAIAPICSPVNCPWGEKALGAYLGDDEAAWAAYDATLLAAKTAWKNPVLVDQGMKDEYLHSQLKPDLLEAACKAAGIPLILRMQEGYDHTYYFIASVIGEHIAHHAAALRD